jgi:hypothetical protein
MENEIGEHFYDKLIFKVLEVKLSLAQVIRNFAGPIKISDHFNI